MLKVGERFRSLFAAQYRIPQSNSSVMPAKQRLAIIGTGVSEYLLQGRTGVFANDYSGEGFP